MNSLSTVLSNVFYELPPIKVGGTDDWFEQSMKRARVSATDHGGHFSPSRHASCAELQFPYHEVVNLKGKSLPDVRALTFKQVRGVLGIHIFNGCANTHELIAFAERHPKVLHELGILYAVGRDEFSAYQYGSMIVSDGKRFHLKRVDLEKYTFRRNAQFLFRCLHTVRKQPVEVCLLSAVPS